MRTVPARWLALRAVAVLVGLFLIVPTLMVVPMSFNGSSTLGVLNGDWTTRWYSDLFGDPRWRAAAANSLKIALGTTALSLLLGTLAAWGLSKGTRFGELIRGASLAPVVIPPVILGVGMYTVLLRWELTGSLTGLVLAHTVLALPFVIVSVSASFAQLDPVYERAAMSLGANGFQRFVRVVVPLVAPGVVAGGLFAFVTSWDEIVVAIFLTDASTRTLPVEMWIQMRTQVTPTLAALGTALFALSTVALLAMQLLRRDES
ncbi:ABC transporter permease [Nocardioides caldifontis]|uniref:ABC transporter permease n=1 Tax=Nocardioides caldifontis TaxID=2588938 RepID=UPI0011DFD8B0|nr:ABC transporter permease [Nocardioides caldifontis]